MRRFIKKFQNSIIGKILKAILKVLWWGIEIGIIFLAIVIVTQRVTNNEKAFLGFRIFNVATGSMEPEYAVGDILISREREPEQIKVGHNIVYLGDQGGYDGKIITHNVIEIEQNENGEYLYHTKGRANTVEDPIVHEDQLYGVIVQNNIVLAWICKILLNRYGLYFFVIIPIILHAFVEFVKVQGQKMEEEREQRRLQEEKRKKNKKGKTKQTENILEEEVQEEEEIIEEIKTPKKKTSTAKKKVEDTDKTKTEEKSEKETVKKVKKTSKTSNVKSEEKEEKSQKTEKVSKAKKEVETTKKTTKKKQAKEE